MSTKPKNVNCIVRVDTDYKARIKNQVHEKGFKTLSSYLNYLIEKDLSKQA